MSRSLGGFSGKLDLQFSECRVETYFGGFDFFTLKNGTLINIHAHILNVKLFNSSIGGKTNQACWLEVRGSRLPFQLGYLGCVLDQSCDVRPVPSLLWILFPPSTHKKI